MDVLHSAANHQATGLELATYRAYNPLARRWISRDPTGLLGSSNTYAYVTDNPIFWVDPLGLIRFAGGTSVTVTGIIGRGFTGGTNGEVFSNGTGDVYGVKGTGKGFDASASAEINGAIYSGPKDGGADTWAGGFTSYNVGIFGFVFSYFHGGGWKGFAFGVGVAPEGVDFGVTKTHTTYVPIIPIRYLTPCSPLSAANK